MRRADGLGGFGVALHPFSKGGKRDRAERSIPAAIRRGGGGTEFRPRGESSTPELSSTPVGKSRYLGTEFRLGGESDPPELSSTWEEKADSSGTEFRLGRRKQIPRN